MVNQGGGGVTRPSFVRKIVIIQKFGFAWFFFQYTPDCPLYKNMDPPPNLLHMQYIMLIIIF